MSKNHYTSTVYVDFAGSVEEAKAFCQTHAALFPHGLKFPRTMQQKRGGGEWPIISAAVKSGLDFEKVQQAFAKLGWDRGSLLRT